MKLTIGFSKPKGKIFPIFSWIIRLFEGTKYSHIYVRWHSVGAGVDIVYQASGSKVNFMAGRIFDNEAETIRKFEVEIDMATYKKLLHYCMTNAGVNYGTRQVLGIALVKLFNLKKNPFSDGRKSQVCSELVANIIEDLELGKVPLDLDVAGPKDIEMYLEDSLMFKEKTDTSRES